LRTTSKQKGSAEYQTVSNEGITFRGMRQKISVYKSINETHKKAKASLI
jgi:hypothetical protein